MGTLVSTLVPLTRDKRELMRRTWEQRSWVDRGQVDFAAFAGAAFGQQLEQLLRSRMLRTDLEINQSIDQSINQQFIELNQ